MPKTVAFNAPMNPSAADIQRKMMMAQMLMGAKPVERTPTRIVPRESLAVSLLPALQNAAGMYLMNKAGQQQQELKRQALAQMLGAPAASPASPTASTGTPATPPGTISEAGAVPGAAQVSPYNQALAKAMAASEAGIPEAIIKPYLESQAPTDVQKNAGYAFDNPTQARETMRQELMQKGNQVIDGRLVDAYGRVITDLPMRQPGIQYGRDQNGNLVAGQIPGFAGASAGIAGAQKYAEEAATLQPDLVNARAGQAGAVQGAQQRNTVFPNQTMTGPDGRVYEGVPVWGSQIPGVNPAPSPPQQPAQPPAPAFGFDKRKADTENVITSQRLQALAENAKTAESTLQTLQQIKQYMDAGALGTGPIDRLQRGLHNYGFPTEVAANTKQIEQLGSALQLARGSLGVGVSNYDAQVYSKAAGDFAEAQNPRDRQKAYERMVEAATNIMRKANSAISQYQQSGQAPAFGQQPARIYSPQESAADLNSRVQSYYGK